MKNTGLMALAVGVSIFSAQADTTALWDFTGASVPSAGGTVTGGSSITGLDLSSTSLSLAPQDGFTPVFNILSTGGYGDDGAYLFINPNGSSVNGSTLSFTLTASDPINLDSLDFDYVRPANKSPTSVTWSYQIVGGASGNLLASELSGAYGTGDWQTDGALDLSGIGALTDNESIIITGTLAGANGNGIGFDNLDVLASPVPEPGTCALAGLGWLAFAGRFYRRGFGKVS